MFDFKIRFYLLGTFFLLVSAPSIQCMNKGDRSREVPGYRSYKIPGYSSELPGHSLAIDTSRSSPQLDIISSFKSREGKVPLSITLIPEHRTHSMEMTLGKDDVTLKDDKKVRGGTLVSSFRDGSGDNLHFVYFVTDISRLKGKGDDNSFKAKKERFDDEFLLPQVEIFRATKNPAVMHQCLQTIVTVYCNQTDGCASLPIAMIYEHETPPQPKKPEWITPQLIFGIFAIGLGLWKLTIEVRSVGFWKSRGKDKLACVVPLLAGIIQIVACLLPRRTS
jgi:hypothetical protein